MLRLVRKYSLQNLHFGIILFEKYFLYKNYNVGDVVSETSATMRGDDIVKTVIHIPEGSIKNNYDVSLN